MKTIRPPAAAPRDRGQSERGPTRREIVLQAV